MAKTTVDVLVGARKLLTPRQSWKHGAYTGTSISGVKQRCAVQAVKDANGVKGNTALNYILAEIKDDPLYKTRLAGSDTKDVSSQVIRFNDHSKTTKYDVLTVMDRAIAKAAANP